MKRQLIAIFIISVLFATSGCWNRRELNTLAIIMAIGIDKAPEDGKIKLTTQVLKPDEIKAPAATGGQGSPKGVWVLTSTGHTIFDAYRNATMQSDRKLYNSQTKVIVISEEMARAGVRPILDFFDRDHELRRLSWLLIAKGEAKDIIEAEHEQEKIPAQAIESLVTASGATSMAVTVNLHEFLKMLANKATDPFASRIEIIAEEETEKKAAKKPKPEESQQNGPRKRMRLTGAAVFKDDKLAGWLNRPETRGLNWILGKVKSGIIIVKSPKDENQYVALEIIRASSKIIPEIRDGQVTITVEVEEEGNLGEQMSDVDLTTPEYFDSLERRQATVIKNEIAAVLRKAQKEWGTDIFGFGDAIHRKFPREWKKLEKKWDTEFSQIEVKVKVISTLMRFGLHTAPAGTKRE